MVKDYLKVGHRNAITRSRLSILTGMCDRAVRKEIELLREELPIVNLQDGKGYFIAETEEELNLQIALYKARLESMSNMVKLLSKFKDSEQMEIEGIYSV